MKMKKWTAWVLALVIAGSMAGCAKETKTVSDSSGQGNGFIAREEVMESPAMGMADSAYAPGLNYGSVPEVSYDASDVVVDKESSLQQDASIHTTGQTEIVTSQKLIRKIQLEAETEDLDGLLFDVNSKIAALGGYVEQSEIYTGTGASYKNNRRAYMVIRIPVKELDGFVSHVTQVGNVTSTRETSEDVTLTYTATESRKIALEKEQERLLSLIDKAADLTELLMLEERLTEVRTDLEYAASRLRLYDNLVDYSTVTVTMTEVQKLTPVTPPTMGQEIREGFTGSVEALWEGLKSAVISLAVAAPYLLPLTVVAVVAIVLFRRAIRKRKVKNTPPQEA